MTNRKIAIAGMLTSIHNEWATPQELFDKLNNEFHFTLDLAADISNAKCPVFYSQHNNALEQYPAGERIFCNPPYGREIGKFVKKCSELAKDNLVVMLIPARTDTKYWGDYIYDYSQYVFREGVICRFIKGRVKFAGLNSKGEFVNTMPATFPSCIIIFSHASPIE
jgi:site-specific DNA-methyltransferase (adenine-specific)